MKQKFATPTTVRTVLDVPAGRVQFIAADRTDTTVEVLPAGSRVEAKAAAAEFRVVGRLGHVAFDGGHGSVKLDEAESVRLTGLDAHITVGRLNGPGEISTQRGDVHITEAVRGRLTLNTRQGDITVGVARGVSASLDAGTGHGRIDTR